MWGVAEGQETPPGAVHAGTSSVQNIQEPESRQQQIPLSLSNLQLAETCREWGDGLSKAYLILLPRPNTEDKN